MVPPSARSSSATAPSRATGLATATASMSTLAVAGAAAEVEIFMGPRCGREREPRKGILRPSWDPSSWTGAAPGTRFDLPGVRQRRARRRTLLSQLRPSADPRVGRRRGAQAGHRAVRRPGRFDRAGDAGRRGAPARAAGRCLQRAVAGRRRIRRDGREVHRRRRDGRVRRSPVARGRPGAGRPRGADHDLAADRRRAPARRRLRPAGRHLHGRCRRRHHARPRLPGDRRDREPGGTAAAGRRARRGADRRAHLPGAGADRSHRAAAVTGREGPRRAGRSRMRWPASRPPPPTAGAVPGDRSWDAPASSR